jgi:hypothetical protein
MAAAEWTRYNVLICWNCCASTCETENTCQTAPVWDISITTAYHCNLWKQITSSELMMHKINCLKLVHGQLVAVAIVPGFLVDHMNAPILELRHLRSWDARDKMSGRLELEARANDTRSILWCNRASWHLVPYRVRTQRRGPVRSNTRAVPPLNVRYEITCTRIQSGSRIITANVLSSTRWSESPVIN